MEIILNYIETMFAGVPVTPDTKRLREDITANMSDKFDELTKEGKSTNEAIGTVISEFGSIDEVLAEMGIERTQPAASAAAVIPADPSAKIRGMIRSFGLLASTGAGVLVLALIWLSEFGLRGYQIIGVGSIGFFMLLAGMLLVIISVLMRTKLLAGGEPPKEIQQIVGARYEKVKVNAFRLKMISGWVKLAAMVLFFMTDPMAHYSVNGTIYMTFLMSAAFAADVFVRVCDRTYRRVLGKPLEKLTAGGGVRALTVPFFTGAIAYMKFSGNYDGLNSSSEVGLLLMSLYIIVSVAAEMFDLAKKKNEQSAVREAQTGNK